MTTFDFDFTDKRASAKYGTFECVVVDAKIIKQEDKTFKNGKREKIITICFDFELENGKTKKLFVRLPFDYWDENSAFNQMLSKLGLLEHGETEELESLRKEKIKKLKTYTGKKFICVIAPKKEYNGRYKTFTAKDDGREILSYEIVGFCSEPERRMMDEWAKKEIGFALSAQKDTKESTKDEWSFGNNTKKEDLPF